MGPDAAAKPEPLRRLLDSYSGCLTFGQAFLEETRAAKELDLDRLDSFLLARADLLAAAERNFQALEESGPAAKAENRPALRRQVVAVLEEMVELENNLSAILDEHLREIGAVLIRLRRVRPVFQRYSHLGGDRAEPSLITRHE